MPTVQLDDSTPANARRLWVVGMRSDDCHSWMMHASLLRADAQLTYGQTALVYHMCPPLMTGPGTPHYYPLPVRGHWYFDAPVPVHVIGYVDGTDADAIESWAFHIGTQIPTMHVLMRSLHQYVMCPHQRRAARDTLTGTQVFVQLSCVGFVHDCYEHGAGIRLLDWQSDRFPRTGLADLVAIYHFLANPSDRQEVLEGPEPWPVPLPGHLFHALSRPPEEMQTPYLPRSPAEAHFPSRPTDPLTAWEHAEARRRAFRRAWDRCGGPPHGTEAQAIEDFEWAAGEVTAERPPVPP